MKTQAASQIQKLINSIDHNKPKSYTYNSTVQEAIVRYEVDAIAIDNNLFCFDKKELSKAFKEYTSSIVSHLVYVYGVKIKNNKTKISSSVRKAIIEEIVYYSQDRRQVFIDMDILLDELKEHRIFINERKFIKIKNHITDFNQGSYRNRSFRSVQSFKKWLTHYLPCSIDNISVKKVKDRYEVSSLYLISIPYSVYRIKKLEVEMIKIDSEYHTYSRIYEIVNHKEKRMRYIDFELKRLSKTVNPQKNN